MNVSPDRLDARNRLWEEARMVLLRSCWKFQQLDSKKMCRTDVYWELASGEKVVNVRTAAGSVRVDAVTMLLR